MDSSGLLLLLALSGALCRVVPWPELDEAKVSRRLLLFLVWVLLLTYTSRVCATFWSVRCVTSWLHLGFSGIFDQVWLPDRPDWPTWPSQPGPASPGSQVRALTALSEWKHAMDSGKMLMYQSIGRIFFKFSVFHESVLSPGLSSEWMICYPAGSWTKPLWRPWEGRAVASRTLSIRSRIDTEWSVSSQNATTCTMFLTSWCSHLHYGSSQLIQTFVDTNE